MADITLAATTRTEVGSAQVGRLRRTGRVPGVVYGKGTEPKNVSVDHHDLSVTFANPKRRSEEFTLELDGNPIRVTMHDIQRNPVKGVAAHIDFLLV